MYRSGAAYARLPGHACPLQWMYMDIQIHPGMQKYGRMEYDSLND